MSQLVIIDEWAEWESNVVKLKRKHQDTGGTEKRLARAASKRVMRHKAAITAANNAVKRAKVKQKNRAKNRVARKSRRINRGHKR